jgi:hypothetical protein
MKGRVMSNPLEGYSALLNKSSTYSKQELQSLVLHISKKSLQDDVVCKLTVSGTNANGKQDIEFHVSDMVVMLAVAQGLGTLNLHVQELRRNVRANTLDQQGMTNALYEIQAAIQAMTIPREIANPIVADLTRAGLLP